MACTDKNCNCKEEMKLIEPFAVDLLNRLSTVVDREVELCPMEPWLLHEALQQVMVNLSASSLAKTIIQMKPEKREAAFNQFFQRFCLRLHDVTEANIEFMLTGKVPTAPSGAIAKFIEKERKPDVSNQKG